MTDTPFYTLSEAARLLGVHYETVARWVRLGKLPAVRLPGRKILVPKEKLDAWVAGRISVEGPALSAEAGSPERWHAWMGLMTPKEAQFIRACRAETDVVDDE